ncbi:MAG: DUF1294 domain-containing protein [Hydrogenophaga sp.]|uniref:DUF1294 domain-containing protein n=1 Tax=unclassified Hydrogenophaga TaxID=2610897 RepID=UPI00257DA5BA|nr:DUF1294 domain-containing protein [Hydrogenophaga sp.]MBL0946478.1 DUF1294 domain-containing protein [Hydrogenophaga sp.]
MKKQGVIVRWDPAQACGHIRSPDTPAEVYFHIGDYDGPHPVETGTPVVFNEIVVGGKGPRALAVRLPPPPPLRREAAEPAPEPVLAATGPSPAQRWREARDRKRQAITALALLGGWSLLWLLGIAFGRFPWVVLTGVVLVNAAAFFLHWRDQYVEKEGGEPVPTELLHLVAALGGWPSAWLAQHALQHRLNEPAFQRVFIASAALNVVALFFWVVWPLAGR